MGLLDEIAADKRANSRRVPCRVAVVIASMEGDDRAELIEALAPDSGCQHTSIARVLQARGFDISDGTVGHHRKGECTCEPFG